MKKGLVIWICMLVLLAVGVLAVQPQITVPADSTTAIEIIYPKADCMKIGEAIYMPFDVLNANFSKLDNTTTTCNYYISNLQGVLLQSGTPTYDSANLFWSFEINTSKVTNIGEYNFYIYCNKSASENGFVSLTYHLTNLGVCPADDKSPIAAIIIIPILFGILLLIGSFMFGEDHAILKIALFLIAYLTIFVSLWFGMNGLARYYGFADLQEAIGTTTWIIGIIFFVILSYFMIYAFIQGVEAAAQKKRKELEY